VAVPAGTTQAASTFTVHITSPTTAETAGTCPNSGVVSNTGNVTTTNDGSDNSTATNCVNAASISITKVADDNAVEAGQPIGFTITVTNAGPGTATGVHVSDTLPTDPGTHWTIQAQDDAGVCSINAAATILTCDKASLAAGAHFNVHIVSPTTVATAGTSPVFNSATVTTTNDGNDEDNDQIDVFSLQLTKTNNAPIEPLVLPNNTTANLPTADEGSTVTYTLTYDVGVTAVTNGTLKDVLPLGVTYVANSATSNGTFTFVSYTAATRTLLWTAATVSADGSVTYQAKVDTGASLLSQPLTNTATIDSEETSPDSDTSDIFVPTIPLTETAPPTDVLTPTEPGTTGSSLLVMLAILGVLVVGIGFVTPVPAAVKRRNRR
jgi:uncharacterized repeat protein (TIGR01451 family)